MTQAWEVFRFELDYQVRRASTRVYLALFLGFALVLDYAVLLDARNDGYFFNAPIVTGLITTVTTMLALLVTAGVAGDAATRDAQVRIEPLLYSTPVRKAAYLGGRFLGAFALLALLLLAVPIGLLLATKLPGLEPQLLGPFRAEAYLTSYFVLALPNAFVATAVLFALATLTSRAIVAYGGAVFFFSSVFIVQEFIGGKLGKWDLARVLDPLGYTAVHTLWRSYNPLQKNTLPIGLDPGLLTNRMLWVGFALVLLALAYSRLRLDCASASSRSQTRERQLPPPETETRGSLRYRIRERELALPHSRLLAIALDSLRDLHRSRAWWIVPFTAILFIATAAELLEVELGTPGTATTARVADLFASGELTRLVAVLIAISAGELVWRERDARIHAITDAAPVPEWLSFLGKFLALGLMLVVTEVIFLASGMTVQAMLGHFDFQFGVYLQFLFGFQLSAYLLFAALAMVIHVLVNQKYVANVLAVLAYIGTQMARELGVRHNLLLYGGAPVPEYTEMGGFGGQLGPWLWFTFYWSGWALLFGVVAYLFWMRGEERGVRWRLALARRRLTRWPASVAAAALAIIAGAGGFVFYNTNILNRYYTDSGIEQRRAEYERRYGRYASLPQPTLAATKLHVEFFPERGAATIRGSYRLDNHSGAPVDSIHLLTHPGVATTGVAFDRPARATHNDHDFGYRIYALGRPMQPGESVNMDFEVRFAPRGFTNAGRNPSVQPNGSWFQHRSEHRHGERQWLPFVGYRTMQTRPVIPPPTDLAARHRRQGREQIRLETIVGTDAGQLGVAPGSLQRRWTENGRSYAHYITDAPISNTYAIYSANYAVQKTRWRDVEIEVLHHPPHTRNLERMLRSVRASLDYHTRHYGPYPHRQLRLVQYPSTGHGLGLTSFPGLIEYSDGYALVRVEDDERQIDLPYAVMAHEIGHQWWGHQLVPALVEGAPLLSESLAWYSAMLTVEEDLGREHLTRLLDVMRSQYMAPHETRDVPLLRSWNRLDAYRTGPFAMFALREAAGAERVNGALRNLLAKFDPANPPYATSLDLYAELRAATPNHGLLKDLFEDITFWDLRARKLDVHGHRVTLHLEAQKLKADALGKEKPVPMDDLIEIAAFDANGKAIYRRPHRIRSGAQTVTFTVPSRPARVEIDPDHELLDRKPEDNGA